MHDISLGFEEHYQFINIPSPSKRVSLFSEQIWQNTSGSSHLRDIKAPGGTKGFSARTSVVARYYFTPEYMRAYISELRNMTDDNKSSFDQPDLSRSEDLKNQRR